MSYADWGMPEKELLFRIKALVLRCIANKVRIYGQMSVFVIVLFVQPWICVYFSTQLSLYTNPLNFDCLVEEWWWWLEKLKWLVPHKFHTTTDSLRSSILGLQCILHLMPNMHSFRHYFCTHLHGSANGQNYIGIVLFSRVQIVLMISLHHAHVIKVDVGRRKFFSQSKLNKTKPRGQF